jgi:hypothetical protein
MAAAQGLYKVLSYKKQTALGTPASGSGGQTLRRETATFEKSKASFNSNEITTHQQYTGDNYGSSSTSGEINGNLSPKTYADLLGSLNRSAFSAGVSAASASLTIAGTGPSFTITRAAGSYLTDGFKVGDVVRITAGTFTGVAANLNLLVTNLTATVMTVIVPNGKTLSAQGPVTGSTIGVVNKKSVTPSTGQANDYYTFEEWMSDATLSRTYTDTQIASADISVPANGDATVKIATVGLGRALGNSQVLTTPAAPTSTSILSGVHSTILVNGASQVTATSLSLKVDGQLAAGEPVIGSTTISDVVKGDLKVTGSFTVVKTSETNATLFENETPVQIVAAVFVDATDTSDFVSFSLPRVKLFSDKVDDGKKQLISSHDFVAEYNGASGGATAATDTGVLSIQDSAA